MSHFLLLPAIRKQEEVLQESYMMIPDSKSRLEKAFEDLRDLLVSKLLESNSLNLSNVVLNMIRSKVESWGQFRQSCWLKPRRLFQLRKTVSPNQQSSL